MQKNKRKQLLDDGFCVVENVLSPALLQQLRQVTHRLATQQSAASAAKARATGSMISAMSDPLLAELIALPNALDALHGLKFEHPTFSDGWIISKPPHGPRLFWHYDWFAWEDPVSYEPEPPQVALMYYLVDTTRENGCLRVIPGSHVHHNPLHDLLAAPHSAELSAAVNMERAEFWDRPDEMDVPITAGDLLIADARLLHAAHANQTDERRTLITLWYQPDWAALPERVQAQIAKKTQQPPAAWPQTAIAQVTPLLARYTGTAAPYERSLYQVLPQWSDSRLHST